MVCFMFFFAGCPPSAPSRVGLTAFALAACCTLPAAPAVACRTLPCGVSAHHVGARWAGRRPCGRGQARRRLGGCSGGFARRQRSVCLPADVGRRDSAAVLIDMPLVETDADADAHRVAVRFSPCWTADTRRASAVPSTRKHIGPCQASTVAAHMKLVRR